MNAAQTAGRGLIAAALLLTVTSCGASESPQARSQQSDAATSTPTSRPSDPPCPDELPYEKGDDESFGTYDHARTSPKLPPITRAWRCQYSSIITSSDDLPRLLWRLDGPVTEVPETELRSVTDAVEQLTPPVADEIGCTEELGSRILVVVEHAHGRIGIAVDDFSCQFARLSDDPLRVAPGSPRTTLVPSGTLDTPKEALLALAGRKS